MQIAFGLVCLSVVGVVAGVGAGAISSAHEMSAKQRQELDVAIDRIVSEHNESKDRERREAVAAATAMASVPVVAARPESRAAATDGSSADSGARSESATRPLAARDGRERDDHVSKSERKLAATSQSQRNQRSRLRRTSRNTFPIPQALVSIPRFATSTLFGFR